ncbi:TSUP family transporter [Nesterenkonia sp. F]|uniref:TSUP family transporter n=1 Tax=Nesterenkonia sp. F TaxID=795955 RepID=UPI000255CAFA|nr:TSUP family transporter [Nesterenkonia sp. F]
MDIALTAGIVGFVLLAATVQRIAGMGFGMIMAPFMVVLLGAHEGVMLVNFISILAPVLVLPRVWRSIRWDKVLWISVPAVLAMAPSAWVSVNSPAGPLYVLVAALVLLGLASSVVLSRVATRVDGEGRAAQAVTGVGSGVGTVLGGVGGPAVTIYAVLSRWQVREMVATLQPVWILLSLCSFLIKLSLDDGQLPDMPLWGWGGAAVAIVAGILAGERIQRRVREQSVRRFVVLLASLGSVLALVTGVQLMLA